MILIQRNKPALERNRSTLPLSIFCLLDLVNFLVTLVAT